MTDDGRFEHRIARHYVGEAPDRAPGWVLDGVLATVDTTRQRHGRHGAPWRSGVMGASILRARSRLVIVAVLLTLLLVASAITLGSRRHEEKVPPFSLAVPATFKPAGGLSIARSTHVAVLLADGRVLVIGGDALEDRWALPGELYDPRTGTAATLDDPGLERGPADDDGFTATLLADGHVLITGGWDGNNFVDPPWIYERAAVLFDPATGTSRPTGPMDVGRTGHVAARLADGRVLMVGGTGVMNRTGPENLASAEIYDPLTATFSPTGPMSCPRTRDGLQDLSAFVLPSGRVLVIGGEDTTTCGGDEIYDPATGRFAAVREPVDPRPDLGEYGPKGLDGADGHRIRDRPVDRWGVERHARLTRPVAHGHDQVRCLDHRVVAFGLRSGKVEHLFCRGADGLRVDAMGRLHFGAVCRPTGPRTPQRGGEL